MAESLREREILERLLYADADNEDPYRQAAIETEISDDAACKLSEDPAQAGKLRLTPSARVVLPATGEMWPVDEVTDT